jgi:hypothetical protein
MMSRSGVKQLSFGAICAVTLATATLAQKVVVSHDEWYSGTCCFAANEQRFVSNTLNWFGVGSGGSVLIYSDDSFLTNSTFTSFLTSKGITFTSNASATSFAGFGAVIVEGNASQNTAALTAYVKAGGNVLYMGGTGVGGPAVEAAYSNPFLNAFGFNFASSYNALGTVSTAAFATQGPFGAFLFTGVPSVFANSGNTISLTGPVAGVTSQLFSDQAGSGVFGAATFADFGNAPEPSTVLLLSAGLLGLGVLARRRKS